MGEQENPLELYHSLSVVLPGGMEKSATVHGSKPVMDVLVTLCASYHLNPSDYTVEVLSANKNNISFTPSSLIGSLEADKIVLKPKGVEEKKQERKPYMPEASVRLLINYNKSHKAVVRVNPRVPLETLLQAVSDKCEFSLETTVLLRDAQSTEPLDLTKSLNDHGLREVFALDTAAKEPEPRTPEAAVTPTEIITPPPLREMPKKKNKQKENKQKENTGFLSLFRRRKNKPDMEGAGIAQASTGLRVGVSINASSNTLPADMPKKRRAPQPPMGAAQSVPNNLSTCHLSGTQRSAESTLRSTKRRAPPPPCANTHQELQADTEVKVTVDSLSIVEELRESHESDSVNPSLSSSPRPYQPRASSSSSRPCLPSLLRGKDLSDARYALAKVLTSSFSKGTLVNRLRNSSTIPKLYNGSSFMCSTQKCSDDEVFWEELECVRTANLPTEPEPDWEDPLQRTGMTTFKVVPSKAQKSNYPEINLDVSDQITVEEHPEGDDYSELGENQSETEEDSLYSHERSETEISLQSPEPSTQESEASEGPASPAPPHHLDNHDGPGSPLSEVGHTAEKQNKEDEAETIHEEIPTASSDCCEGEAPSDGHSDSEDQNEILQSPSRRSVSTDMDQSASCIHETEEEMEPEEAKEDSFPPPPPPVCFNEDIEVMVKGREDTTASPQPQSPTSNGQTNTLEPTQATPNQTSASEANALNDTDTSLSRFAQAVALAVERSRIQSHSKALGPQVLRPPVVQTVHQPQHPDPHTSMVPDCLPHTSLNGSPC